MRITKVYKESFPPVKLIGRCYTNKDRDESGTFAKYWQACFQEGWQNTIWQCEALPEVSNDLVGAMRMLGPDGDFEYWIGAFMSPGAAVPDGFQAVEIPAGEVGVCWLYGNDKNGELYSMEASDLSMAALAEKGWKFSESGWFFERYNGQRFMQPDEDGNVILDICAYLV